MMNSKTTGRVHVYDEKAIDERFQRVVRYLLDKNRNFDEEGDAFLLSEYDWNMKTLSLMRKHCDNTKQKQIFQPQGLASVDVNHNISWKAGDRILSGLTSYFKGETDNVTDVAETIYHEATGHETKGTWLEGIFSLANLDDGMAMLLPLMLMVFALRRDKISLVLTLLIVSYKIMKLIIAGFTSDMAFLRLFELWEWLNGHMQDKYNSSNMEEDLDMEPVYKSQGFEEHSTYCAEMIVLLVSLGLGFKARDPFFSFISNAIRFSDKQKENLASSMLKMSIKLNTFFTETINNETLANFFYVDIVSDIRVKELLEKLHDHVSSCNAGTAYCDGYREEIYDQLLEEVRTLLKKLDKNSYDYRLLSTAFNDVEKLNLTMKTFSKSLNGDRIEPFGVLIKGLPGVFKTVAMERIAILTANYTIPEFWKQEFKDNPKRFFFPLPNDKFFDGYDYKAWITTMDDLFQRREVAGDTDPDSLKVIKMINTAPYLLPMAAVDSKNSKYFRSAFVMANTNLNNFRSLQAIEDHVAVERRFNLHITVTINPVYLTPKGKLNFKKLPQLEVTDDDHEGSTYSHTSIPNDFWIFNVVEVRANKFSASKVMDLESVVVKIIEGHHDRIKDYHVNKLSTKNAFEQMKESLDKKFNDKLNRPKWTINPNKKVFAAQGGVEELDYAYRKYSSVNEGSSISTSWTSIPGSYVELLDFNSASEFRAYIDNFKMGHFDHLVAWYYDVCKELKRMDLFDCDLTKLREHISRVDRQTQMNFVCVISDQDPFKEWVYVSFLGYLENGINPVSMEKEYSFITFKNDVSMVLKKVKCFFTPVFNFIKNNFSVLLLGGAALGTFAYFMYKAFSSAILPYAQSVDFDRMGSKHYKKNVGRRARLSNMPKIVNIAQGMLMDSIDLTRLPNFDAVDLGPRNGTNDIIAKILNKYLFIIYVVYLDADGEIQYRRLGHSWNIIGQYFSCPFHYIYKVDKFTQKEGVKAVQLTWVTSNKSTCYRMPAHDFLNNFETTDTGADKDQCLIYVPVAQRTSTGVLKYLLNNKDMEALSKNTAFDAILVGTTHKGVKDNALVLRINRFRSKFLNDPVLVEASWSDEDPIYQLENVAVYKAPMFSGDCGSLLFSDNANFQNRILMGMHVGGDANSGFSTLFTYEDMMEMLDEVGYKPDYYVEEEIPDFVQYNHVFESQAGLKPVGSFSPKYTPNTIVKTAMKRSQLFGKLPPPFDVVKTYPARLREFVDKNGIVVNPCKLALTNYAKEPGCIPYHILFASCASYEKLVLDVTSNYVLPRTVIPLREALHSFRDVKPIASNTSPGHPMTLSHCENLKDQYFKAKVEGKEEISEMIFSRIAEEVEEKILLMDKGIRPFFVYTDNLKDEKRKIEKVQKGITRMFSGSPFILLCLFRMYFGAFMDAFTAGNVELGSAIGLNPYSEDWDKLARYLKKFTAKGSRPKAGAGDHKHFDGSEQPSILNLVLDIINAFYRDHGSRPYFMRCKLWAEVTESRHIFALQYYEWHSSLPSGTPLTALINTIYNQLAFRVCFMFAGGDIEEFNSHVYVVALGDDNAWSTSPKYEEMFNELTMPGLMKKAGMVFTNEAKEAAIYKFRDLSDIEFLKRSFKFLKDKNRWIAPLQMESIAEMLNWTKKGLGGDQIAVNNIGVACRELSLHGNKVYNQWFGALMKLKQENYPGFEVQAPISSNYDYMLNITLETDWTL